MYGIFTCIYHKNPPNVGKYTMHGCYGIYFFNKNVLFLFSPTPWRKHITPPGPMANFLWHKQPITSVDWCLGMTSARADEWMIEDIEAIFHIMNHQIEVLSRSEKSPTFF